VPKIATFGGIAVMLYFGDHPPPHLHVRVGRPGDPGVVEARILIDTGELIDGVLPAVKVGQVTKWCREHRTALRADWERAQRDQHPTGRYS
jgi:hypothetical protein